MHIVYLLKNNWHRSNWNYNFSIFATEIINSVTINYQRLTIYFNNQIFSTCFLNKNLFT